MSCVFTAHQERGHPGPCFSGSRGKGTGTHRAKLSRDMPLSLLPQTLESVDVHCFGHLLYEMTYGRPPDAVPVDSFPPAPSMAVGQYGVWGAFSGPWLSAERLTPFSESRKDPEEVVKLHSQKFVSNLKANQFRVVHLHAFH